MIKTQCIKICIEIIKYNIFQKHCDKNTRNYNTRYNNITILINKNHIMIKF